MALVDYSSSDSASEPGSPPVKRRKASGSGTHGPVPDGECHDSEPKAGSVGVKDEASNSEGLPPLPAQFHDLYASTVRTSTADDPTLHQGRKRTIPHIAGNWPSHVYIEWHPTADQHYLLVALLDKIKPILGSQKLYPLLTSDLNAPLPLHISLSRPLSLPTAQKDHFLSSLTHSLSAATGGFYISPRGIGFFKSPDSDRAFLVLRVADPAVSQDTASTSGENPQLQTLLTKCNAVALRLKHPLLYQTGATELVDDAFHMSIGWTFGLPPEDACLRTCALLEQPEFRDVRQWHIGVSGVKIKIGNVITHVPLTDNSRARKNSVIEQGLYQ
ncbi:U6 snRNA phosphodiesterase [Colletotrichum tanaceti]|uniref:U6 snRNA phosphodiesterase n=1 Tax=Colletotrichum tanaceti TaxID=1306861 RepID=A0A4U6XU87_9PEZI|nr:U6 snRNA phosphodiesterase [Colletotrichum tanaceti]TKW59524.1 U6 snRNA phosphodiesterase [Colletotrichum tanaceti]